MQLISCVLHSVFSMETFTTSRWAITSMRKMGIFTARWRCARRSTGMVPSTPAMRPLRSMLKLTRVCKAMLGFIYVPHLNKHCCVINPAGVSFVPHLQLVSLVGFDACWALFPSSRLCRILSGSPPVTGGHHVTLSVAFQKVCVEIVCIFFLNPMCAFLFLLHTGYQNLHYSCKVGPQRNV